MYSYGAHSYDRMTQQGASSNQQSNSNTTCCADERAPYRTFGIKAYSVSVKLTSSPSIIISESYTLQ